VTLSGQSVNTPTRLSAERTRVRDQYWATQAELTVDTVRALRRLAGIPGSDGSMIAGLESRTFSRLNQVVLIARYGACLRVYVFSGEGGRYRQIWALRKVPGARGFGDVAPRTGRVCDVGPARAAIRVAPSGEILITVPEYNYVGQRSIPSRTYMYQWNGSTYELRTPAY
jgi:hypothetical protein